MDQILVAPASPQPLSGLYQYCMVTVQLQKATDSLWKTQQPMKWWWRFLHVACCLMTMTSSNCKIVINEVLFLSGNRIVSAAAIIASPSLKLISHLQINTVQTTAQAQQYCRSYDTPPKRDDKAAHQVVPLTKAEVLTAASGFQFQPVALWNKLET